MREEQEGVTVLADARLASGLELLWDGKGERGLGAAEFGSPSLVTSSILEVDGEILAGAEEADAIANAMLLRAGGKGRMSLTPRKCEVRAFPCVIKAVVFTVNVTNEEKREGRVRLECGK